MKFYECYAEGQSHFFASQQEAEYLIRSLREDVGGDYAEVERDEIFREVDLDAVDLENFLTADFDALSNEGVFWGDTSPETRQAMTAAIELARRVRRDAITRRLYDVMTVEEIAHTYGLEAGTVRVSIHRGYIHARKSGKSWLIHRDDARARWGKKR